MTANNMTPQGSLTPHHHYLPSSNHNSSCIISPATTRKGHIIISDKNPSLKQQEYQYFRDKERLLMGDDDGTVWLQRQGHQQQGEFSSLSSSSSSAADDDDEKELQQEDDTNGRRRQILRQYDSPTANDSNYWDHTASEEEDAFHRRRRDTEISEGYESFDSHHSKQGRHHQRESQKRKLEHQQERKHTIGRDSHLINGTAVDADLNVPPVESPPAVNWNQQNRRHNRSTATNKMEESDRIPSQNRESPIMMEKDAPWSPTRDITLLNQIVQAAEKNASNLSMNSPSSTYSKKVSDTFKTYLLLHLKQNGHLREYLLAGEDRNASFRSAASPGNRTQQRRINWYARKLSPLFTSKNVNHINSQLNKLANHLKKKATDTMRTSASMHASPPPGQSHSQFTPMSDMQRQFTPPKPMQYPSLPPTQHSSTLKASAPASKPQERENKNQSRNALPPRKSLLIHNSNLHEGERSFQLEEDDDRPSTHSSSSISSFQLYSGRETHSEKHSWNPSPRRDFQQPKEQHLDQGKQGVTAKPQMYTPENIQQDHLSISHLSEIEKSSLDDEQWNEEEGSLPDFNDKALSVKQTSPTHDAQKHSPTDKADRSSISTEVPVSTRISVLGSSRKRDRSRSPSQHLESPQDTFIPQRKEHKRPSPLSNELLYSMTQSSLKKFKQQMLLEIQNLLTENRTAVPNTKSMEDQDRIMVSLLSSKLMALKLEEESLGVFSHSSIPSCETISIPPQDSMYQPCNLKQEHLRKNESFKRLRRFCHLPDHSTLEEENGELSIQYVGWNQDTVVVFQCCMRPLATSFPSLRNSTRNHSHSNDITRPFRDNSTADAMEIAQQTLLQQFCLLEEQLHIMDGYLPHTRNQFITGLIAPSFADASRKEKSKLLRAVMEQWQEALPMSSWLYREGRFVLLGVGMVFL